MGFGRFIWYRGLNDWDIIHKAQMSVRRLGSPIPDSQFGVLLARLMLARPDTDAAEKYLEESRSSSIRNGYKAGEAVCTRLTGWVYFQRRRVDEAERLFERARNIYRELGDLEGEADCLCNSGEVAYSRKRFDECSVYAQSALSIYIQTGNRRARRLLLLH